MIKKETEKELQEEKIESKKWNTYKDVKIGVYAICADEPKEFIDRWLDSMKGADYIWVFVTKKDNPNTDYLGEKMNLPEFCGKLIVKEREIKPWRFDVARNESLKMVDEDAVDALICTDVDEILIEDFWDDYRKMVYEHPDFERIFYQYAWSHYGDGSPNLVFWYDKTHQPKGWKWQFPVHETLYYIGDAPCKGLYYLDENKIYLHHYPDNTKSRGSYLSLLQLRAEENPDDLNGLFYLAREYGFHNSYEQSLITLYTLLIRLLKKEKETNGMGTDLDMMPVVLMEVGKSLERIGLERESSYWYSRSISSSYGSLREGFIRLAQRQVYDGNPDAAEKTLELMEQKAVRLLDWREQPFCWRLWKFNQIKADICMWREQYNEAAILMQEALQDIKDETDIQQATGENFYGDLQFLQEKLKERIIKNKIEEE